MESDKEIELMVRQKAGLFDFKELYSFVFTWLSKEGYDTDEKEYTEKVKPYGKEIFIEWHAYRRISDYFKFHIKIVFSLIGMTDVEVAKEGTKLKMNRGEVRLDITGYLEKDYDNKWETSPISKFLRGVYDKYVIRNRILVYEDKIRSEVYDMTEQIKAFLALEAKR